MLVNNLTSVQITDFAEDSQKGDLTRVEGEVVDVKAVDGAIEITLKGDNKGIICELKIGVKVDRVLDINKGQEITLKGKLKQIKETGKDNILGVKLVDSEMLH